jgi:molecular chaperone Hsp33
MTDQMIRATAANGHLRVVAVTNTLTVNEASRRHQLSPIATAALGRALSACSMLTSSMKQRQGRVNVRFCGDGPLGLVYADAGVDGTVRGFVSEDLPVTKALHPYDPVSGRLDIQAGIGQVGLLKVMRDIGYGEPYTSTVQMTSGEIDENIAWYLASSEQTYSKLVVSEIFVNPDQSSEVQISGGVFVQMLPGSTLSEDLVHQLEAIIKPQIFQDLLQSGLNLQQIIDQLFAKLSLSMLPLQQPIKFSCRCSFDRMLGALKILGEVDLKEMIAENKGAEAKCHFCGETYHASTADLEDLLTELTQEITEEVPAESV